MILRIYPNIMKSTYERVITPVFTEVKFPKAKIINPVINQLMTELNCGMHIHYETLPNYKRMKPCLLPQNGCDLKPLCLLNKPVSK